MRSGKTPHEWVRSWDGGWRVRYADFTTITRSHTLSRATSDADVIASWAKDLVERTDAGQRAVRLLGVRVQGLVEQGAG